MGLLDGVIGGLVGGEMATVVNGLIERHGGVSGIVAQLEKQGLGPAVKSWVGTGPNQPVTADQLSSVLGSDKVAAMAQRLGVNPQTATTALAALLPVVVDHLTPKGQVEPGADLGAALTALKSKFLA